MPLQRSFSIQQRIECGLMPFKPFLFIQQLVEHFHWILSCIRLSIEFGSIYSLIKHVHNVEIVRAWLHVGELMRLALCFSLQVRIVLVLFFVYRRIPGVYETRTRLVPSAHLVSRFIECRASCANSPSFAQASKNISFETLFEISSGSKTKGYKAL